MIIAFVLRDIADLAQPLFWDIIAPIHKEEDTVEFWLSGPSDILYADPCLLWLEKLCFAKRPDLILFSSALDCHDLGVRLAARLNLGCFPETTALFREKNSIFARKKVCGSNLNWDAQIIDYPAVLTIAEKKTAMTGRKNGNPQRIESRTQEALSLPKWILEYEQSEGFKVNPLESAPLIFVAGRGVGNRSACNRLRRIAEHFGAPLGLSRPAALNGWGEIEEIIGQSGLHSGSKLCIAVGVSGAAAFMAGIAPESKFIAVNPDKNAPIFHYADVGIIAYADVFIDALEKEIRNG